MLAAGSVGILLDLDPIQSNEIYTSEVIQVG